MGQNDDFSLISRYRSCLMGIAALWILIFHEWVPVFHQPVLAALESMAKKTGFCGVDMFFFLSGMGLTFSIKKGTSLQFYSRRLKRILIPFVTVALVCLLEGEWTVSQFFGNITAVNFYMVYIYSYLWFVPAIVTLYILFPPYYKLFSGASNKVVFTAGVLLLWYILSILLEGVMRLDLYDFTNRIPIFCMGVLAGYLTQNCQRQFSKTVWIVFGFLMILGMYCSYLTSYKEMRLLVPESACCVPHILLTIPICFGVPKLLELLDPIKYLHHIKDIFCGAASFFGMISLELYCVQEMLSDRLRPFISGRCAPLVENIAIFSIVTAAAFSLYIFQKSILKLFSNLCPSRAGL